MPTITDLSLPALSAARLLGVAPGSLTLDDLAHLLSVHEYPDQPVSVRDHTARPVTHSAVWFQGERQTVRPYLTRFGR